MTGAAVDGAQEASLRPHADELVGLAEAAIDHGLARGEPAAPELDGVPEALRAVRGAFVTLRREGELRGCIGTIEAHRPLAADVTANAFGAAFRDPRFPPVSAEERSGLTLKIEVLTTPEPLAFAGEEDLLAQLRPGTDGLLIEAAGRKGTFLPTVWEQLPEPRAFWTHLKRKAGLPADYSSAAMAVYRYRTEVLP
ncbi:MAG TPA: AmmeMemoRadiSam system protein A [Gammaproteobacteria bacterium]|nr:AmmeMemoRadiSam system protein A [Gammaproteobacteria bacterium]